MHISDNQGSTSCDWLQFHKHVQLLSNTITPFYCLSDKREVGKYSDQVSALRLWVRDEGIRQHVSPRTTSIRKCCLTWKRSTKVVGSFLCDSICPQLQTNPALDFRWFSDFSAKLRNSRRLGRHFKGLRCYLLAFFGLVIFPGRV